KILPSCFCRMLHLRYSSLMHALVDFYGQVAARQSKRLSMRIALAVALSVGAAATALAADVPAPPASPVYVPVPPSLYDWTGIYFGANLGADWSRGNFSDAAGNTFTTTSNSQFLGGGQLGVNYQFWGRVVIGAEGVFDWFPNSSNSSTATALNGNAATVTINNRWLTTATGRLGYTWDRVLLYGKAGGAWVGGSSPGLTINGVPALLFGNTINFGWPGGLGVEWAFGTAGRREPSTISLG